MAADAGPRPGVDAMKKATSFNPYEASEGHWDYGLLLRAYPNNPAALRAMRAQAK